MRRLCVGRVGESEGGRMLLISIFISLTAFLFYIARHIERPKEIGKSGTCALCQTCKKRGCFKNSVAKVFKLAGAFSGDCYEKSEVKE